MKECPACSRCFPDNVNHCPSDGDALRVSITGDTVLDSRYQLEKRLGQGGMGIVFKGRHVYLKTSHAIKIILPDLVGNDPSLVTRFRQEAMAAANIRHQNIINVTDFGVVNNTMPFLVMELCEGRSLHDILNSEKRLPPARAIEIMLAVAAGVGAAHNQGIVHRDLKPLNIMLKDDCSAAEGVKVLDFGLAKIKSGDLLGSFVAAQTQGLMGSPFYMAPEQWSDEEPDARADIYSLGIILYQMLAGEVPFRGNSIPSIMKKHLGEPPPPFAEKGVEVPPEVERVVRHALEKEPEKRPQAVVELSLELLQALSAVSAPAAPSAVGPATSGTDFGMKTEVSAGPGTIPPEPARAGAQATGELAARGGVTSADTAGRADAPPAFEESAPAAPTRVETSPRIEYVEGRETAHDIAAGATALIPDAAVERDDSLSPSPPPTSQPSPSTRPLQQSPPQSPPPTSSPASTTPLETSAPSVLPPAPPAGVPEGSSPGFTESPSFYAAPPAVSSETQAFATMTPSVEQLAQFQDSSQTTVEPAAPPRAGPPPPTVVAPPPAPPLSGARAGMSSAAAPSGSRVPMTVWAAGGVLALLFVVAGLYFALKPTQGDDETNLNVRPNVNSATPEANRGGGNANANVAPTPPPGLTADLVALPGGSFIMGRNDVPPRTSAVALTYQAWMYNQWPAHNVSVQPFAIDRTEVTNAEYAEFVEKTNHAPPAEWGGKRPPAGQEKLPVGGVSLDDAERFARWRSERDGVQYRLPTEVEWEYAARGGSGDAARLYPWGADWADGRANLEAEALRPVGSFPEGATPQGALDMIGNVWEWTSTEAGMYRGNNLLVLAAGDRGKFVVRGGSYQSKSRGDEPVTATARRWVPRGERNTLIGFRLVRPGK